MAFSFISVYSLESPKVLLIHQLSQTKIFSYFNPFFSVYSTSLLPLWIIINGMHKCHVASFLFWVPLTQKLRNMFALLFFTTQWQLPNSSANKWTTIARSSGNNIWTTNQLSTISRKEEKKNYWVQEFVWYAYLSAHIMINHITHWNYFFKFAIKGHGSQCVAGKRIATCLAWIGFDGEMLIL